jgi:hypothetical protein
MRFRLPTGSSSNSIDIIPAPAAAPIVPWILRNYLWGTAGPRFGHDIEASIPIPALRYEVIDGFGAILRFKLENLVRADYTLPPDQIIDYPPVSDDSRYTFSLFAFPEAQFPKVFSEFFAFVRDYR